MCYFGFCFAMDFFHLFPKKDKKKKKGKNSDGPIKVATKNDSPGTRFLDFGLDFGLF
jgi:hypothetical protein